MGLFNKLKTSLSASGKQSRLAKTTPQAKVETNSTCPYCGALLQKPPKRKTKCSDCNKDIFYRSTQTLFSSKLLTEEQANVADEYKNFIFMAQEFGFSEDSYQKAEQALAQKFGKQPNPGDVIWSLYNQLIQKVKEPGRLKGIYYSMSLFLNKEGKDHNHTLSLFHRMDVTYWKANGYNNFEIYSQDGCNNCKKLHGKKVSYDQVIAMKVLPYKNCTTTLFKGKKPFCRCYFNPS